MPLYSRRQAALLLALVVAAGAGIAIGHWRRGHPGVVERLERFDRDATGTDHARAVGSSRSRNADETSRSSRGDEDTPLHSHGAGGEGEVGDARTDGVHARNGSEFGARASAPSRTGAWEDASAHGSVREADRGAERDRAASRPRSAARSRDPDGIGATRREPSPDRGADGDLRPRSSLARPRSPATPATPVDLNRGSALELERLPGIGPMLAARIVDERDTGGPYASVDDLRRVRGMGAAKLERVRALVRVER